MIFSFLNLQVSVAEALLIVLAFVLIYVVSLTFHEYAHAYVAYKCGDLTPKIAGRLTFNPAKHIDFWGFVCFMVAGIGWAKPVPINPINFKKFRTGIAKVSIAGVLANLILVIFSSFAYVLLAKYVGRINLFTKFILYFLSGMYYVNSFLIVFNLLPIYPLDGFNFLSSFLPSNSKFIDFNVRYGVKVFFVVIIADVLIELLTGVSFLSFIIVNLSYCIYNPFLLLWGAIF